LKSEAPHPRHAMGGGDRYSPRQWRVRDGSHQARALLLEDSANPPRAVADTRNGAPAALFIVEKLAGKLSAQGLGPLQAGVDAIQGRLNIRRSTHVEISGC